MASYIIIWQYVYSHTGDTYNDRADALAKHGAYYGTVQMSPQPTRPRAGAYQRSLPTVADITNGISMVLTCLVGYTVRICPVGINVALSLYQPQGALYPGGYNHTGHTTS